MVAPARTDQMTRSGSRNLLELAARTRPCHLRHPPLTAQKAMVANHLVAMLVSLTKSLSEITNTLRMSWRPAILNTRNTVRPWTTLAYLLRRSSPRLLILHQLSAIILNPTVVPSLNSCHRTQPLQPRASTATIPLQDSASHHPAQLPATTTTTWKMALTTTTTSR